MQSVFMVVKVRCHHELKLLYYILYESKVRHTLVGEYKFDVYNRHRKLCLS